MKTRLEKLNDKQDENRKALTKACAKRDKAITDLSKAADQIKKATQALARTEKLRNAAKAEAKRAKKIPEGLNDSVADIGRRAAAG